MSKKFTYQVISGPGQSLKEGDPDVGYEIDRDKLQRAIEDSLVDEGTLGLAEYAGTGMNWLLSMGVPEVCNFKGEKIPKDTITYGTLYLNWRVTTNKELSDSEVPSLEEFITGQCSDGWGEGFEQHKCYSISEEGEELDIFFCPWYDKNCMEPWTISTKLIN